MCWNDVAGITNKLLKQRKLATMVYSATDTCDANSSADVRSFIGKHRQVALFGAGKNGEFISHFLKFAGLAAACFVDNNPARIGQSLNGIPIESADILLKNRYGVVITSELHADAILAQLLDMGIRREDVHVLRLWEFQQFFDTEPDWPAYIISHHFIETYRRYFAERGIDCSGAYLEGNGYSFPNPFLQPLDYQISFFSEIVDYVLPSMCEDYSMLVEGTGEYGPVQINRGDVVFDCGANIGLFSMLSSAKGAKVYAFEPVPGVIRHLERAKEIHPSIEIIREALSDHSGKARISLSNGANTGNSLVLPAGEHSIEITTTSVDEFVARHELERIDFIKADIEGAERLMLAGATDTLKKFSPKLSICTYHLADDKEVLEKIIKDANPDYVIEHKWQKLYAHVPEQSRKI